MKIAIALISTLATSTPTMAQTTPWECRSAVRGEPTLNAVASSSDSRFGEHSWTYDPASRTVFGLPASYLMHYRNTNYDGGMIDVGYTAVVRGDVDNIRWLIERASPDLRCVRNGGGYSCMKATAIGTRSASGYYDRWVSVGRANIDDHGMTITEGIAIECAWTEPLTNVDLPPRRH